MNKSTGTKRTASASASSKSNSRAERRRPRAGYVMCVDNTGYEVSLQTGKVYRQLPSTAKVPAKFIRVVDESGEDYLFPQRFVSLTLPARAKRAVLPALAAS